MTYRRLGISEWDRIVPIFEREFREPPPRPTNGIVVVAETDSGEIVGLATVQMVAHIEPVWVKSTWRGRWVLQRLVKEMYSIIPTLDFVFAFVSTTRMCMLLRAMHMEELPWKVFRWRRNV